MIDTNDDWCRWRSILTSFAADHPQINPILSMDLWWISHSTKLRSFIVVRAGAWSPHTRDHDQAYSRTQFWNSQPMVHIMNHIFCCSQFFHVYRYHNGKRKKRRRRGNWWKENWCQGTLQLSIFWSPLQKKHPLPARAWQERSQKLVVLLIHGICYF